MPRYRRAPGAAACRCRRLSARVQLVLVLGHGARQLGHQPATLDRREASPDALERLARRRYGEVDVGAAAARDRADRLAIAGIDHGDGLAGCRRPPIAADKNVRRGARNVVFIIRNTACSKRPSLASRRHKPRTMGAARRAAAPILRQARMLMNCPRGWFREGVAAGRRRRGRPARTGAGAWFGVGAGAVTRVTGDAGLTGRACRRLR